MGYGGGGKQQGQVATCPYNVQYRLPDTDYLSKPAVRRLF